jgi:uncharacterized protein YlxP (DUF503 family)
MPIGKLTLAISIPHAQSLKDRRQVVRSLKAKLRNRFNASVCEAAEGTVWNSATLELAVITSSMQTLQQYLESIDAAAQSIAAGLSAEIADSFAEILPD